MVENIANIFLSFSHDTIIVPLVIIGYIWLDRKVFFHATCLLLISMLFNHVLKNIFQIPLSSTLYKEGFAFPSGHMQSSFVLYGWLMAATHNFLARILIIILLFGIALSLIYFDYHNYYDILGAIFFGFLLMTFYMIILKIDSSKIFVVNFFIGTALMIYISLSYELKSHLWMSYYALMGFVLAGHCFKNKQVTSDKKNKIIATIFCFVMLVAISQLYSLTLSPFLAQTKWLFIGFCIVSSIHVLNFVKLR